MDSLNITEIIKKDKVKFVQLQFTDLYGIVKSLTIPVKQLPDALKNGVWFDGSSILGFSRICESDMYLKPVLDTYAVIPWLQSEYGNTARFICDVHTPDGRPFEGDPRFILKKAIAEANKMGFIFNTGPEMEFFLFKTDNGLSPLPHDTAGYFDLTTDEAYDIRREMSVALEKFGKAIAQKHGLHATFMPKPIADVNGSGMHVHQSLVDIKTGKNAFYKEEDEYKLSKIAYNYIAGQLARIKGMSAVLSPTVNSYKRLVPGYEAPVYICWGRTNRSALIRVPSSFKGNPDSTRVEIRSADPSCNIYLAFAVMLKAGLEGIRNNLSAPKPLEEDLYLFSYEKLKEMDIDTIPPTLWQALRMLKKDKTMKNALGKHTFEKYLEAKTKEWDEYSIQVTKWELDKYLEIY
jgi:glutamine synthetase